MPCGNEPPTIVSIFSMLVLPIQSLSVESCLKFSSLAGAILLSSLIIPANTLLVLPYYHIPSLNFQGPNPATSIRVPVIKFSKLF